MLSFIHVQRSLILTALVAGLLGYSCSYFLFERQLVEVTVSAKVDTASQLTVLNSLTEAMSRGGADSITEQVIKDCTASERTRFDEMLGRLASGLSRSELTEVSRLFDRCGSFYSRQKALMAARLDREVKVYEQAARHQSLLTGEDLSSDFALSTWQTLVSLEKEQSDLYAKLVDLQGQIINALQEGKGVDGANIASLLQEVREVLEMQSYNAMRLRETRDSLPTTS